jgi:ABC-type dipeptide/oligopeptide/nickel transport system ATPase component
MAPPNLLEIRHLQTHFFVRGRVAKAVDDVSLAIAPGRTLGLVGESGCGKSVTAHAIIGLIPVPPGRIVGGQILFEGTDLLRLSQGRMRKIRGNRISMIFQEPMTSLNPVFTIGRQIVETLQAHERMSLRAARDRAVELLDSVGIPSPRQRLDDFPHQLSGGMRQRAMVAMALSCSPRRPWPGIEPRSPSV